MPNQYPRKLLICGVFIQFIILILHRLGTKISPFGWIRHRFIWSHYQQKDRTHNNPIVTVFHYTMFTNLSVLLSHPSDPMLTIMIIMMQQIQTAMRYPASSCFARRLVRLRTDVLKALSSVRQSVSSIIARMRIKKKITAQGPWRGPVPFSSIVPIVIPQSRIENILNLQRQLATGLSYLACLATLMVQRKSMKNMRARMEETMSMKYRKAMSWGQWHAVEVMVAPGKGFYCL